MGGGGGRYCGGQLQDNQKLIKHRWDPAESQRCYASQRKRKTTEIEREGD